MNELTQETRMLEDDVKLYLKEQPQFFEKNAAFLADIHLPSPHGGGTISLAERQQLAQRDKIAALEDRFAELVLNARENDITVNKIHALNLKLHQAKSFDEIEQLISDHLPEYFDLTETCLRLWVEPLDENNRTNLVFSPVDEACKTWLDKLEQPYCGLPPAVVKADWFIEPAASIAIIPLRDHHIFGFLALSSLDKNRFFAEIGTDFLSKTGEILSAALSRVVYLE